MTLESFKSLKWADLLIDILTDPPGASREIQRSPVRAVLIGLAVMFAVSFAAVISSSLISYHGGAYYLNPANGLILDFITGLIIAVLGGSVIDSVLQLSGKEGRALSIIALVMISSLPRVFLLPFLQIIIVTGFSPRFFYYFISFLLHLWVLYAGVSAMAEMHKINFTRSLLIYVSPLLLFVTALFFILIIGIILGLEIFSELMPL